MAPPGEDAPLAVEAPLPRTEATVQLLAINDLHGRIGLPEEGTLVTDVPGPGADGTAGTADDGPQLVGGAVHLATTLHERRADFGGSEQDSLLLAAGDLVGASTFASATFADEPTIEVLDAIELDFSAVGNHEFDRGKEQLYRLSGGTDGRFSDDVSACEGVVRGADGCFRDSGGQRFDGSHFGYLGANVLDTVTGAPALPPYAVVPTTGGTEIGVIGVVTGETPAIVPGSAIRGLTFQDPATAANRAVAELRSQGVEAIVLLAHEGGRQGEGGRYDTCVDGLSGTAAGRLNAEVAPAVDAIIGGHTHAPYTCLLDDPAGNPRPVTQAAVHGASVTDIRLTIGTDGDVVRSTAVLTAVPVLRAEPDPALQAIVDSWESRAAVTGDGTAGLITETITRAPDPESGVGILVADALLAAATRRSAADAPVMAFMNQGMVRADLVHAGSEDADGTVTFRELFRVMPFDHTVQVVTLSGSDIRAALEEQFAAGPADGLSTSAGVTYAYDPARDAGDRVDPCSLMVDGRRIDPAGSYRVALSSYLLGGGGEYTAFTNATAIIEGPPVLETLTEHVAARSPLAPPPEGRSVATPERLSC